MKKVLYIIIPLLLLGYMIIITLVPRTQPEKPKIESRLLYNPNQENYTRYEYLPSEHSGSSMNCKSCHLCEYPTKDDPCLIYCPRDNMVSVYHSPEEGPEVVEINEMSDNYMGVIFPHKIHAQGSDISTGCVDCHHYNTTGPVLNCRKCHDNVRYREDVSIPDLKAAYHRQCMGCHKQWSLENGCNTQCHQSKSPDAKQKIQERIKSLTGKSHPKNPEQAKIVWETNYEEGKIVTFYHSEHSQTFRISCRTCHSNDNCTKCHKPKGNVDYSKPVKIEKSFEEHHKLCTNCHKESNCKKCHSDREMEPFNHGKTAGWTLKFYHSRLECTRCHGSHMPYKKVDRNCTSCHSYFTTGKYDHKGTGLILSENHRELECENCHIDKDFSKNPECKACHDDLSFPKDLPGKRTR